MTTVRFFDCAISAIPCDKQSQYVLHGHMVKVTASTLVHPFASAVTLD